MKKWSDIKKNDEILKDNFYTFKEMDFLINEGVKVIFSYSDMAFNRITPQKQPELGISFYYKNEFFSFSSYRKRWCLHGKNGIWGKPFNNINELLDYI